MIIALTIVFSALQGVLIFAVYFTLRSLRRGEYDRDNPSKIATMSLAFVVFLILSVSSMLLIYTVVTVSHKLALMIIEGG